MHPKPMLEIVLDRLQEAKGRWPEIARSLGGEAPASYYSWLTKLATGAIREPSVNRIQALYDYFMNVSSGELPGERREAA